MKNIIFIIFGLYFVIVLHGLVLTVVSLTQSKLFTELDGTTADDKPNGVAVDEQTGDVYVTGGTGSKYPNIRYYISF